MAVVLAIMLHNETQHG